MNLGLRCYEYLRAMDDVNGSKSLAQGYRGYQNLRVVDDMNEFRS